MATKLTAGQRKFLKQVASGEWFPVSHVRVSKPLFDAGLIFPRPGALLPWIVGCCGQSPTDYFATEAGADALSASEAR